MSSSSSLRPYKDNKRWSASETSASYSQNVGYRRAEKRCPVALFKQYLEKRHEELKKTRPFYLAVIDKPQTNVWYKKTPMGKNTINNIMKTIRENSPLKKAAPKRS